MFLAKVKTTTDENDGKTSVKTDAFRLYFKDVIEDVKEEHPTAKYNSSQLAIIITDRW